MPRTNAAELITSRVNVVKASREKYKNPFANEHFGGFLNKLLHEVIVKYEFLK